MSVSRLTQRSITPLTGHAVRQQLPLFLAPALAEARGSRRSTTPFSTSTKCLKRDMNRNRGVSALRRTGPKQTLSVSGEKLPQPVLDPAKRTKLKADPDHGLWGFFPPDRKALMTPEEMAAHGRAWSAQELRNKSWEDLHALWWACVKERNMIATQELERQRLDAGYGEHEAYNRDREVKTTQKRIKHVLTERWYAYQNALKEVKNDPGLIRGVEEMWEDVTEEDIARLQEVSSAKGSANLPLENDPQTSVRQQSART